MFADFTPLAELHELRSAVYLGDGKKFLSEDYLKALTPLALAIWYMDDGSFTVAFQGGAAAHSGRQRSHRDLRRGDERRIAGASTRLPSAIHTDSTSDCAMPVRRARPCWSSLPQATAKFQELIASCMCTRRWQYKLLPRFRGQFKVEPQFVEPTMQLMPARVMEIESKTDYPIMSRYDIEVEGSHNYFVDGVMVHNSPETTTGGKALKFYASVRLDVRRIETLKDGTDAVGNRTR